MPLWQTFEISPDQTHHLVDHQPVYSARFLSVLKFHEPGIAPAKDQSGAFHIDPQGGPVYSHRFMKTFGFYEGRAAVESSTGWHHILPNGTSLYDNRFAWCGNFQQQHSVVKNFEGSFFHINLDGKKSYEERFRYAGDFRDGHAVIQNEKGEYTHIDFNGLPLHGKWFLDLDVYHKRFARAKGEDGWFHIDRNGKAIYPERYQMVEPFYNGVARVETETGALHLITENGETIHTLRKPLQDPFHQASAELVSYWRFYTLQAAIELQLFDHLPNSTQKLSQLLTIPENSIQKLLKALQDMGIVDASSHLTPKGSFFDSRHPYSLKSAADLWKDEHLTSWKNVVYTLRTGLPAFDHLFGENWFHWLENHPVKRELYHQAISTYAKRDYRAFCSLIDLKQHRTLLDVGGSSAALLFDILNQNPHLEGMLLDLPNVISTIEIPAHLQDRMKCIPVDFFESWPPVITDGAILSRILHDWSDEKALEILRKTHSILTSRLYIIENVLEESGGNGGLLDLNMSVMTGGTERTLSEFNNLLQKAGFRLESTYPLNQVSHILVAKKEL